MMLNSALFDQTAKELMSREVLTIPQGTSLRAAVHILAQAGVSGAPVVDPAGRCVGVLSKTDLLRFLDREENLPPDSELERDYFADWQVFDKDALPTDDVSGYMTKHVISAGPDASVSELARIMHRNHIHRVLITDALGCVIGIVASLDILGVIAAEGSEGRP